MLDLLLQENFTYYIEDVDSFLTTAEKQKLILHEMEAVRASDEEDHIPGYDKIKLWTGKSICEYLKLR